MQKDTKAQENATSDNVSISAPTLASPASYLESFEFKELHESLDISVFQNSAFNLYRSIVNLQYCKLQYSIVLILVLWEINSLYMHMYPFFLRFFSCTGYYRLLSRIPELYSRSLLIIY